MVGGQPTQELVGGLVNGLGALAPTLVSHLVKAPWGSLPTDVVEEAVGASGWPPAALPDPSVGAMAVPEDPWHGDMATNLTTLGKAGLNGAGLNGVGLNRVGSERVGP